MRRCESANQGDFKVQAKIRANDRALWDAVVKHGMMLGDSSSGSLVICAQW
jgi:hypothetical protein